MNVELEMPDGYFKARHQLADELLAAGAVRIAAPDFYIYGSRFTDHIRRLAARCMGYIQLVRQLPRDAVVGIPKADKLAEALANCTAAKRAEVRIQHTGRRGIACVGNHGPGEIAHVVVVNDQIRSGKQVLRMVQSLREAEATADHVLTLFDWELGAKEVLAREGVRLHSVYSIGDLFDTYVEYGAMSRYERASIGWKMAAQHA